MYKVFFVDDEAAMRAGIRNTMMMNMDGLDFDPDGSGFVLAGEAPDGEMALSLMQDILPDILITDVRMPFMDGIELARLTKQTMPWVKIIIISGYDEFEYARQAITIGVEDYLLKPVTSVELYEALNKVAAKIEQEKERQRHSRSDILSMFKLNVGDAIPVSEPGGFPVIDRLRHITRENIPHLLDDYMGKFEKNAIQSLVIISYMFTEIVSLASKIIEEHNGDPRLILSEFSGAFAIDGMISDSAATKAALLSILEKAIDFRDAVTGSKYVNVVRLACEYIHKNYQEQDISLHSVAKAVNISPNYFSSLFSKEIGETFTNYITRIRVDNAKNLLKTTKMRTSEIAYEVGYNDTHYFSYVFRKNTGMTPKEYRSA
jgi:two-component system response regulator YesN